MIPTGNEKNEFTSRASPQKTFPITEYTELKLCIPNLMSLQTTCYLPMDLHPHQQTFIWPDMMAPNFSSWPFRAL